MKKVRDKFSLKITEDFNEVLEKFDDNMDYNELISDDTLGYSHKGCWLDEENENEGYSEGYDEELEYEIDADDVNELAQLVKSLYARILMCPSYFGPSEEGLDKVKYILIYNNSLFEIETVMCTNGEVTTIGKFLSDEYEIKENETYISIQDRYLDYTKFTPGEVPTFL